MRQDQVTHIYNRIIKISQHMSWIKAYKTLNSILLQTETRIGTRMRKRKMNTWGRAPQGHRLRDERLEVHEVADEVLHVAWYWAAVEDIQREQKRVEEASVSTQLVLNKYNTNYEALRLADSTALAFNLGKFY